MSVHGTGLYRLASCLLLVVGFLRVLSSSFGAPGAPRAPHNQQAGGDRGLGRVRGSRLYTTLRSEHVEHALRGNAKIIYIEIPERGK